MTSSFTIECCVNFRERRHNSRRRANQGSKGHVPRVSQLMALAIRFGELLRSGEVTSYAELARLGRVTTARMTQVMALLGLAPDLQEEILFLPRTVKGRDRVQLRHLMPIAALLDWRQQRVLWNALNLKR
jgi:hypothetical protein